MISAELERTGAVLSGHYRLSSGLHSPSYVQCARLLQHPADATHIGRLLAERVRPLKADVIVAPALGGVVIGFTVAQALGIPMIFTERKDRLMTLRRGFAIEPGSRVVIVEDVVTTGRSTRETADVVEQCAGDVVGYASILNRSDDENPFDRSYVFLERMQLETWSENECPLCAEGREVDAPGSRFAAG